MISMETMIGALVNLGRHKLRSFLTMLGMIFGVGAVIAMLSIGAGAEQRKPQYHRELWHSEYHYSGQGIQRRKS